MTMLVLLILYFGGIASITNECTECERCKCECFDTGFEKKCFDGCIDGYFGLGCVNACIENCLSCTNNETCTECKAGFYGENCNKCPHNCLSCSSSESCDKCRDGYYNGYQRDCRYKCKDNCTTCTSYHNCTKYACKAGIGEPGCTQCIDGKYGINCDQNCSKNCVKCTSGTTCTKCSPRRWGDKCSLCPLHCLSCNSSSYCLMCEPEYYGDDCNFNCPKNCLNRSCNKINGTCSSCINGFYELKCEIECPKNCAGNKCNIDGTCDSCKGKFYGDNCTMICPDKCRKCESDGFCHKCTDGFYGSKCQNVCLSDCKVCAKLNGDCIECAVDFYRSHSGLCKARTVEGCDRNCKKCANKYSLCESCKDGKYGQLSDSNYPHCRLDCPVRCLNKSCDVKTGHCLYGCKNGYWGRHCNIPCSEKCSERKCSNEYGTCTSLARCVCPDNCLCDSQGRCKSIGNDVSLITLPSETDKCQNCLDNCKYNICEFVNGNCIRGCNDGHWGNKCERSCMNSCLKCEQLDGNCTTCRNDKYAEDCSKSCSKHCKLPNSTRICDMYDGACLHGCDTLTRYGKYCEKKCSKTCHNYTCNWKTGKCLAGCNDNFYGDFCEKVCSVNCLRKSEKNVCNVNGHCIDGCKDGFHGGRCDRNCSTNCLTHKCKRDTGTCSGGCRSDYKGPECEEAQEDTVRQMISKFAIIGAFFGALPCLLIICVGIILFKRRKRGTKKKDTGETVCMGSINDTVPGRDHDYVNLDKPTKNVQESVSTVIRAESSVSGDPISEKDTYEQVITYENAEKWGYEEPTIEDSTKKNKYRRAVESVKSGATCRPKSENGTYEKFIIYANAEVSDYQVLDFEESTTNKVKP